MDVIAAIVEFLDITRKHVNATLHHMSGKIVIVGAGLAGLACATTLMRLGRDFVVVDANAEVGGRVRSVRRDGFVLDLGFQVMLTSYRAVRDFVNMADLRPRFFASGALLAYEGRLEDFQSPLEEPSAMLRLMRLPGISLADKLRLGVLGAWLLALSDKHLRAVSRGATDISTEAYLRRWGFSTAFLARFARPFFGGVLLDRSLSTSAGLFQYYLKKFITGKVWIPAGGIGSFPALMAQSIPAERLRLNTRVVGLTDGVVCADGSRIAARTVVLAVEEPAARDLLGIRPPPVGRSVAVVYFKTPLSLYSKPCLVLPDQGVAQHFVQITNIAPELAPEGWHLVSASVVDPDRFEPGELQVLVARQIAAIFPQAAGHLTHLETIIVPYAVPQQLPGFAGRSWLGQVPVILAGDWMHGASIQSALENGRDAAYEALGVKP